MEPNQHLIQLVACQIIQILIDNSASNVVKFTTHRFKTELRNIKEHYTISISLNMYNHLHALPTHPMCLTTTSAKAQRHKLLVLALSIYTILKFPSNYTISKKKRVKYYTISRLKRVRIKTPHI